jgi:hypothetical protein
MIRLKYMKMLLYFLILLSSFTMSSQVLSTDIIGKWTIIDVIDRSIVTHCGTTKNEFETSLKLNYVGASIEFLVSHKMVYRDKNNLFANDENSIFFIELDSLKWKLNSKNEIETIKLPSNKISKRIKIQYLHKRIFFDFMGIKFILEKQ